jgi:predicted nucleic acid-binding protein
MRSFFDSNILVYAHDPGQAAKRSVARALIAEAIGGDSFVISTQCLLEFYATAMRRKLLGAGEALALVTLWAQQDTVPGTPELLLRGLELHQAHSLSIGDAMIVEAAQEARCEVLLSEDLQHGRRFGWLEVVNPFLAPPATREPPASRHRRKPPRR